MRIDRLTLENFRCFRRYEIDLAPRFTLLIGDNRTGKTAVLDALAVAAGSFFLGVPSEGVAPTSIHQDDIKGIKRQVGQVVTRERSVPVVVSTRGEVAGQTIQWIRLLASPRGRTNRLNATSIRNIARDMVKRVRGGKHVTLPVIAYYGSGRLFQSVPDRPTPVGSPESRLIGYAQCLNPASDPKRLFRWFKTNELAALQKGETRHVLEAVRAAIVALVPGTRRAYWDVDFDELAIVTAQSTGDCITPFHLLSDGYRNLVGLAADIAYRMAVLNPHLLANATRETPGVVLIDEVDLHLHPTWQRVIVGALLRAFPRVQFVGTTHSPFIIQDLHDMAGTMLWDLLSQYFWPDQDNTFRAFKYEERKGVKSEIDKCRTCLSAGRFRRAERGQERNRQMSYVPFGRSVPPG